MIHSFSTWIRETQNKLNEGLQGKNRSFYIAGAIALLAIATFLTQSFIKAMFIASHYRHQGLFLEDYWSFLSGLDKFNICMACTGIGIPMILGSVVGAVAILIPAIRYKEPQIIERAHSEKSL